MGLAPPAQLNGSLGAVLGKGCGWVGVRDELEWRDEYVSGVFELCGVGRCLTTSSVSERTSARFFLAE